MFPSCLPSSSGQCRPAGSSREARGVPAPLGAALPPPRWLEVPGTRTGVQGPGGASGRVTYTHVYWPGEQIFYTRSLERETSSVIPMANDDPEALAPARASSSVAGAPAPGNAQLSPCPGLTRALLGQPAPPLLESSSCQHPSLR